MGKGWTRRLLSLEGGKGELFRAERRRKGAD